jgi:hypothetical protein
MLVEGKPDLVVTFPGEGHGGHVALARNAGLKSSWSTLERVPDDAGTAQAGCATAADPGCPARGVRSGLGAADSAQSRTDRRRDLAAGAEAVIAAVGAGVGSRAALGGELGRKQKALRSRPRVLLC